MGKEDLQDYSFEGQHEGEEVNFVFRQHPIVLRKPFIFFMALLPLSLVPWIFYPNENWPLWFLLGAILLGGLVFFYYWIGWFYSVYVVTDERIIQIKQEGLFNRRVIEVGLDKIQNINYEISGLSATMFQFGTITVQTYAGDLTLEMIYKPANIHSELVSAVREVAPTTAFMGGD